VLLGEKKAAEQFRSAAQDFRRDILATITRAQTAAPTDAIPAAPERHIDCGMIGSVAASYPLQLFPADDRAIMRTLGVITGEMFHQGLFYQDFIHSGLNVYLSLHVAHSFLYCGDRVRFWEILQNAVARASPTLNFPEAVHPGGKGGVMGDGHHGWAAAEIVLALRDAFVYERWVPDVPSHDLVLLGGIPASWFLPGKSFLIRNCPVPEGHLTLGARNEEGKVHIQLDYVPIAGTTPGIWVIRLPARAIDVRALRGLVGSVTNMQTETWIAVEPGSAQLALQLERSS
jgi:hypothetical protein